MCEHQYNMRALVLGGARNVHKLYMYNYYTQTPYVFCNCLNCKGQKAVSNSTVCRHENVYGKSPGYEPEKIDGDFHVDLDQS